MLQTKMRKLFISAFAAAMTAMPLLTEAQNDTPVWRIKSMGCEECAHKVNACLSAETGNKRLRNAIREKGTNAAKPALHRCKEKNNG